MNVLYIQCVYGSKKSDITMYYYVIMLICYDGQRMGASDIKSPRQKQLQRETHSGVATSHTRKHPSMQQKLHNKKSNPHHTTIQTTQDNVVRNQIKERGPGLTVITTHLHIPRQPHAPIKTLR